MAHELHAEDRQAIGEILSLHGHLFDGGHLDRLGEIFTPERRLRHERRGSRNL